jgi:hypothetical protein
VGRAPSLRILPWHLPYNWGKSTEKPQSISNASINRKYAIEGACSSQNFRGCDCVEWILGIHKFIVFTQVKHRRCIKQNIVAGRNEYNCKEVVTWNFLKAWSLKYEYIDWFKKSVFFTLGLFMSLHHSHNKQQLFI